MNDKRIFMADKAQKNIVGVISCDKNVKFECNGEVLTELVPNTSDGAKEKHIPIVTVSGDIVSVEVGSIFHPMSEEHSIAWVYLQTEKGGQRMNLGISDEPVAYFTVAKGDAPVAAYAYCNLHGFWKTDI